MVKFSDREVFKKKFKIYYSLAYNIFFSTNDTRQVVRFNSNIEGKIIFYVVIGYIKNYNNKCCYNGKDTLNSLFYVVFDKSRSKQISINKGFKRYWDKDITYGDCGRTDH